MNIPNNRKENLEEFFSHELFKFKLSNSFSEVVKKCVLKFEKHQNGVRLVTADLEDFEDVKAECAKITHIDLTKFEVSLTDKRMQLYKFIFMFLTLKVVIMPKFRIL